MFAPGEHNNGEFYTCKSRQYFLGKLNPNSSLGKCYKETYPGAWGVQDFFISQAGILLYNEFRYMHSLSLGGVPGVIKDGNTHIPNEFILQIGAQLACL